MNIGFDLDKIFIDHPPFVPDWLINKLYKERDNGILLYRIPGIAEQKIRQLSHQPFLRPPIQKNIAFLQSLTGNKNYNLFLISSRFGFLKKQTERLSQRYKFDTIFRELYFNFQNEQPHEFKNRILRQTKIDKYIDDDLSLVKYLAKENQNIIFYWLNNALEKKLASNIFAIKDIVKIIEQ